MATVAAAGAADGARRGSGPVVRLDIMGTLVHDPFFDEFPSYFNLTFKGARKRPAPTPRQRRASAALASRQGRTRRASDRADPVRPPARDGRLARSHRAAVSEAP